MYKKLSSAHSAWSESGWGVQAGGKYKLWKLSQTTLFASRTIGK